VILTLEGESLTNDGTGLTLLRVAVIVAMAGGVSAVEVGAVFTIAVLVGVIIGAASGWVVIQLLRRSNDSLATNALTLIAPFAIYLGAEELGGSGILAIVVAALWIAHGQHATVSTNARLQAGYVWKHVTFALQAIAFFAIGLELPVVLQRLPADQVGVVVMLSAAALLCLIGVRFLVVFAMEGLPRLKPARRGGAWLPSAVIIAWAGARGPISGLAAFSLPMSITAGSEFPGRDLIIAVTLILIVVTLLISLTLAPLARLLRVKGEKYDHLALDIDVQLARAGLLRLEQAVANGAAAGAPIDQAVVSRLREDAQMRIERASSPGLMTEHGKSYSSQLNHVARDLIDAEYMELIRLRDEELIPDAVIRPLMLELDVRLQALRSQRH
jgi:CPA1 family monovalent cation:H+ antiporter